MCGYLACMKYFELKTPAMNTFPMTLLVVFHTVKICELFEAKKNNTISFCTFKPDVICYIQYIFTILKLMRVTIIIG